MDSERHSAIVLAFLFVSACASVDHNETSHVTSTLTELDIRQLTQRAEAGDKEAQLELGIRYEEGLGVNRDLVQARVLYSAAARQELNRVWIYSPPVGRVRGRIIPAQIRRSATGLQTARQRLERLDRLEGDKRE